MFKILSFAIILYNTYHNYVMFTKINLKKVLHHMIDYGNIFEHGRKTGSLAKLVRQQTATL